MRRCCPDLLVREDDGESEELRVALARLDASYDASRRRAGDGDDNSTGVETSADAFAHVERVVDVLRSAESALRTRALQVKYGAESGDESDGGEGAARSDEVVAAVLNVSTSRVADLVRRGRKAIPLLADDEPVQVLYEDEHVIAVCKPPHLRFHPIHRFQGSSLLNRVVHHLGQRQHGSRARAGGAVVPAPHVVHRLDMDTSGVAILAKDTSGARNLHEQFRERSVHKEYTAICHGIPDADAWIVDAPMRSASEDDEMVQCVTPDGRPASTRFEVVARGRAHCVVRCFPLTGRTHQIRVHLAHVGHAIVGDTLYSSLRDAEDLARGNDERDRQEDTASDARGRAIGRHALHASSLVVRHPANGTPLRISAPLPDDMKLFIAEYITSPINL